MATLQVTATKPHAKSVPISTTIYQEQYEQQQLLLQQQQAVNRRASTRLSTYSITPTLAPSIAPTHLSHDSATSSVNEKSSSSSSTNKLARDVTTVQATLSRLDEPRLTNQRYVVSDAKKEEISKLALGAKLDKALGRRMCEQDATFRTREVKMVAAAAKNRVAQFSAGGSSSIKATAA